MARNQRLERLLQPSRLHAGLDVKIPPTNPITLIADFPTGANSGYVDLFDPGTYEIGLYDDAGLLLDIGGVAVEAGGFYTLDAYGVAGFGVVASTLLVDDLTLPTTGNARVRVLHLRPEPFDELRHWIGEVERFWSGQLAAFKAHAERRPRRTPRRR